MPAKIAAPTPVLDDLSRLGQQIRARRKALRVNATAVAESAGISRVTLHRIEKGASSVTAGAYLAVLAVLGLKVELAEPAGAACREPVPDRAEWIPARIRLADYPQLAKLAWQVHGVDALTPAEAWDIYERNRRHLDEQALLEHERQLIAALRLAFGGEARHV